jgi:hypothetical protein
MKVKLQFWDAVRPLLNSHLIFGSIRGLILNATTGYAILVTFEGGSYIPSVGQWSNPGNPTVEFSPPWRCRWIGRGKSTNVAGLASK